MTKSEAVRTIFASGEPVTLYGTMPKWLVPTMVEKFISTPDVGPSSMRTNSHFQCPNCSSLSDSDEDLRLAFHVAHPTCADWCLTLRFSLWEQEIDEEDELKELYYRRHPSNNFKDAEIFVEPFLCRPQSDRVPHFNRHVRRLRSKDVRNEVFHWLPRAHADKSQLACKEWRVGIDWPWKTLPLHYGEIIIESEPEREQEPDGFLTFCIELHLDESLDTRIFHLPHDAHRDSCLVRNHLRNFFASEASLLTVPEWLTWLRAMFAGLRNSHAGTLKLNNIDFDGNPPHVTLQFIESARPLMPHSLMMRVELEQLDAHLRQGLLRPERLGIITSVFIEPHMPVWQSATALEPEPEGDNFATEPVWMDDLFRLGDRYVSMEYDLSVQTSDFRRSSVPNILLSVAKKFAAADDTSAFVKIFDVLICNSGLEIRVPKVHPDVAKIELRFRLPTNTEEPRYFDAYYISNPSTKDELTMFLKRPKENDFDIGAFRLQRGRVTFEAKAIGE
ncbi:hypothetical protein AAVH_19604 [Aphelenchoides avenae]|nr:hypothetical protein AAVH_19604 [Aphelenchus avenae]